VAELLRRRAELELARGDLRLARDFAERAIEVHRASGGASADTALAQARCTLALVLRQMGALAEACDELDEALHIQRTALAAGHPDLAQTLTLLGATRLDRGEARVAEPLLREALAIREAKLPGHWLTANTASVLGGCLLALGRRDEAEPLLEQSLPALERALGPDDFRTRQARERLERQR
jgi:tetratricopeptide (TPR) repeat protein